MMVLMCACAQVSEVDMTGAVLRSFTDVSWPHHLSLDSEGHLLVADPDNDCILLLNSQLELQRVLIDSDSQVELRSPTRLCYKNGVTPQIYVAHEGYSNDDDDFDYDYDSSHPHFISVFELH